MSFKFAARFIFLVAVVFVCAHFLRRTFGAPSSESLPVDYPGLIDLGPQLAGSIVHCPITISNLSDREVLLDGFMTSCSCAGVEQDGPKGRVRVESVTIPSGGECHLSIRIGVGVKPGTAQDVSVAFKISHRYQKIGAIQIHIPRVDGGVYSEPGMVQFGALRRGNRLERTIEVYDNGIKNLKIAGVSSSRPNRFDARLISITPQERESLHPTAGRLIAKIQVSANTDCVGSLNGEINLRTSPQLALQPIIPVIGEVVDRMRVSPSFVLRNNCQPTPGETVVLEDRDGMPIKAKIVSAPPGVRCELTPVIGKAHRLLLKLSFDLSAPTQKLGEPAQSLKIEAQASNWQSTLSIPVVYQLQGAAP